MTNYRAFFWKSHMTSHWVYSHSPYSIREVSPVIVSSPSLVHMLDNFNSVKKSLLIISFLDCLSCLVTCLCLFGYSSVFHLEKFRTFFSFRKKNVSFSFWTDSKDFILSSNLYAKFSCCLRKYGIAWLTCGSRVGHRPGHSFEPHMKNEQALQNIPLQLQNHRSVCVEGEVGCFFSSPL